MRTLLILFLCLWYTPQAMAYVPVLVEQESLKDITQITDPTLAQGFFGTLDGFPETYEIHATENFVLYVHTRTPDLSTNTNTLGGIVIKEKVRGVSEVARLYAEDASWSPVRETFSGNTYREGSSFEQELGPGVYRIEVHTPNNNEKYVLMVGKRNDMTLGYFTLLGRLMDVQRFNERSALWIIVSPYVYIPLTLLICGMAGGSWWYIRRKKRI